MTIIDSSHHEVVAAIRRTLPEFAQRNDIILSDSVMDNLAYWVAGCVPSGMYRAYCSSLPVDESDSEDVACACTGLCRRWSQITVAQARGEA